MNKSYHFIGIGGIGMSALATLLLDKGCKVSGSDLCTNQITQRLATQGADISLGHSPHNVGDVDCVIYSSAVEEDNPEFIEAKKKKIPIMQRAQLLAELMEGHRGITIAGAHGKTTTSSMIAHLLMKANFKPTTAVGGIVRGASSHAQLGGGEYFVTEVDESDGSFLFFSPQYSVITNIDFEHVDHYQNWQSILDVYKKFIEQTVDGGIIFAYGDDKRLLSLLQKSQKTYKTYGFHPQNNVHANHITFDQFQSKFHCIVDGRDFGLVLLNIPGRHNVANALACISIGLSLSIDFDVICESLKEYEGVQRRFQLKDKIGDVWVIDDYAHHPTEIKAVLDTAQSFKRPLPKSSELITIFQPHRYSRVKVLIDDFAQSLTRSDSLIITDIYAASEKAINGITAQNLCKKVCALTDKPVCYLPKEEIVDYLLGIAKPHDIVLTLGAGDINAIADDFVKALKEQSSQAEKVRL